MLPDLPAAAWRSALQALPVPIAFVGADRRYHFVNTAYERWTLRRPEEIVGLSIVEHLGPSAAAAIEVHVAAALAGATIHFENNIPYRRIGTRRMKVTYVAATDGAGEVIGFFAYLEDLTEKLDAEAAVAKALDGIGDGYMSINPQYSFTYVNSGAARFYGMTREQMLGRRIDDLFPGSMDSPAGRMLQAVMQTRVPQRQEMPSAGRPGRRFLMDIVPTSTGGVSVVLQDTTDAPPPPADRPQLPERMIAVTLPTG